MLPGHADQLQFEKKQTKGSKSLAKAVGKKDSTQPMINEDALLANMRASEARLLDKKQEQAEDFQLSKPKAEERPSKSKGSPPPKQRTPLETKKLTMKKTVAEPK